jgi:isopenicillin-N epimerase
MDRNRRLALRARAILLAALETPAPCPEAMIGSMASVPLPAAEPGSPAAAPEADALAAWARERGIETWFTPWACPGGKLVRASAQVYNHDDQYRALAGLLAEARRAR